MEKVPRNLDDVSIFCQDRQGTRQRTQCRSYSASSWLPDEIIINGSCDKTVMTINISFPIENKNVSFKKIAQLVSIKSF